MSAERDAVRLLGERIGYGNLMHLCEQLWTEMLGGGGGALSVGTCVGMLVKCPCVTRVHCDWCCGSGRVTERVARAMSEVAK